MITGIAQKDKWGYLKVDSRVTKEGEIQMPFWNSVCEKYVSDMHGWIWNRVLLQQNLPENAKMTSHQCSFIVFIMMWQDKNDTN